MTLFFIPLDCQYFGLPTLQTYYNKEFPNYCKQQNRNVQPSKRIVIMYWLSSLIVLHRFVLITPSWFIYISTLVLAVSLPLFLLPTHFPHHASL